MDISLQKIKFKIMFDRVIVSCDDSHFKEFWPIVSKAWGKYFPDAKVSLAFVTDRNENDELVQKMRKYGDVHLFPVVEGIPTANLSKMARHILAGNFEEEICMLEDIDTIPLQTNFVIDRLSQREKGKILFIGKEVYNGQGTDEGKFPISNITGESFLFKKIVNPDNLTHVDLFKSWCNIRVFDHKESINNTPDLSGLNGFSDESLWRVLLNRYKISENDFCFINRGVDIQKYWIDRSWWRIDHNMLKNDEYVICNFLRPFSQHYHLIEPIAKYIFNDENIKKEDVII
jgi:hypothetical protein